MRLISQNGMFDVPYDNFCVEIIRGKEIMVFNNQSDLLDEAIIMATYSTNEKALKVMEMLRKLYLETLLDYRTIPKVFKFPDDSEVEV